MKDKARLIATALAGSVIGYLVFYLLQEKAFLLIGALAVYAICTGKKEKPPS